MNFELQIEKEVKRILDLDTDVLADKIKVDLSGVVKQKFTEPTIVPVCQPRVNINGGLWEAELQIWAILANAVDTTGATLQKSYRIIADQIDRFKINPQLLNATIGPLEVGLTALATETEVDVDITAIDAEVLSSIPATGFIKLTNSSGGTENITYTAFDSGTGIFTVNHLLTNSYAIGDRVTDLNIYNVDGVVNQAQPSQPLQLEDTMGLRSIAV